MSVLLLENNSNNPTRESFINFQAIGKNRRSAGKRQARSVWETFWNVKKRWLYTGNLIDYLYHQRVQFNRI